MINITITQANLEKYQSNLMSVITQAYPLVYSAKTTADATIYLNNKISAGKSDISLIITQNTNIQDYDYSGAYVNQTKTILNIEVIRQYVEYYILYLIYWDLFNRKKDLKPLTDFEDKDDNSDYGKLAFYYESFIRNPETKELRKTFLNSLIKLSKENKDYALLSFSRG